MATIPAISRDVASQIYCIIANADFDLRDDNKEIWPALDILVPTVTEIFKQSANEKPSGLTRGEVLEALARLGYKTTEMLVLVLLNYMCRCLEKLSVNQASVDMALGMNSLGQIRWQIK